MSNDASPFLNNAWKETRNILEGNEWDVEGIAESDKSCSLDRGVDVQTTSEDIWLVSNHADATAVKTSKSNDDVFSIIWEQLEEFPIVNNFLNNTHHVVRSVRIVRDERFKLVVAAINWVFRRDVRWFSIVVIGKIRENFLNQKERIVLVVCNQTCNA